MKKLVLCVMAILCMFAVFASENTVSVKFAPAAVQMATSSKEGDGMITSKYGLGTEVSYRITIVKGLFAEGGISLNAYDYNEARLSFVSFMPYVGLGYKCQLTDLFSITPHVDIAGDTLIYDKTSSESITLKTGLDFGYTLSEKCEFTLGCDGSFGLAKKNGTHYVNCRIIPMLGMNIGL